jgi:hypothetical protein
MPAFSAPTTNPRSRTISSTISPNHEPRKYSSGHATWRRSALVSRPVAGAESLDRPRVCLRFVRPPRLHDPSTAHPPSPRTTNHGITLQATQRGGDLHWSRGRWRAQKASTDTKSRWRYPWAVDVTLLVVAARKGDEGAFRRLLELHRDAVSSTLFACGIRCTDTAHDLAQDTALRAWTKLDRLADPAAFSPWIRRIAANAARGPPATPDGSQGGGTRRGPGPVRR